MIEDIYVISQGSGTENGIPVEYAINLYLTTDSDFLRDNARFVGQIEASTTPNDWTHLSNMPYVLAPVAQVGSEPQLKAFYVPKGKALWAARQTSNLTDNISNAPLLGVSGGFF